MKPLFLTLLFLPLVLLSSCNTPSLVTVGDVSVKSSGRVGGNGSVEVVHNGTTVTIRDNNDDSFRELNKTARFGIGAAELGSVARTGIGAFRSVKNTATAANASTAAAQETTKQAAIAAEQEAARLAAEEAAAKSAELVLPPTPQL